MIEGDLGVNPSVIAYALCSIIYSLIKIIARLVLFVNEKEELSFLP